ncbi:MAG: Eco29kI family restriction endonuclease [Blastocatellia bacterium]|nr:Eco29kI family restriction endonuclease [Blastocatellia bacterium]
MSEKILPFNPLDKQSLGISVAEAMLSNGVYPLGRVPEFEGAGIYAIYYTGDFAAYQRLSERNRNKRFAAPIYVGKAIPSGARKGENIDGAPGRVLRKRLSEHAESIRQVKNLDIEDFHCRFLVVDDIWIPLAESLLIAKFSPVWNKLVDGFGNHDPGKGRYQGLCPRWDVLHPGRKWALKCRPRSEAQDDIHRDVQHHLENLTPPESPHFKFGE